MTGEWTLGVLPLGYMANLCISGHKFWLEKELAKHVRAKCGQS